VGAKTLRIRHVGGEIRAEFEPKVGSARFDQHRTVYDVRRAKAAFPVGASPTRQSLYNCIDLLKGVPVRLKAPRR
jgi:hypothetical protein